MNIHPGQNPYQQKGWAPQQQWPPNGHQYAQGWQSYQQQPTQWQQPPAGLPGLPQQWQQPSPASTANIPAIISLVSGLIGLLVLAIVFGPLVLISGVVGVHLAGQGRSGKGLAIAGIALGAAGTLVAAVLYGFG
ncbi:hypothetical protein [Pseudonocardia sp. H11422]|uniref:hypothetical protein n=1 Tax=Pseudonocardia sp. H11422 TaxID=2835866 RepID=UPI001BDC541F|nr:hypothetical protein [Pseudonocardia sp. H11422]